MADEERAQGPQKLVAVLGWLEDWEEQPCPCGTTFHRRKGTTHLLCPGCVERVAAEERAHTAAEWVLAHGEAWLPGWCKAAGMTAREYTATLEALSQAVRTVFRNPQPGLLVKKLCDGTLPEHGFGLSGGAGTGKTFALAAVFKRCALERLKVEAPREGKRAMRQWLLWARWPEEVAEARANASRYEDGMQMVERRTRELVEVEALVLDDLGAERMKGDYADDWATSTLDRVVDKRFNAMRPTWWTTNLTPEEFAQRYGARMFSRLHGGSPLYSLVSVAPDLRVRR